MNRNGTESDRHDRVQEIVQREIVGKFGKEEEDDECPADDGCIFPVTTGHEERKESDTGDQDKIILISTRSSIIIELFT